MGCCGKHRDRESPQSMEELWIKRLENKQIKYILLFLFCELELNFCYKGHLNGINLVEVQQLLTTLLLAAYIALKAGLPMFKSESLLIIKQTEKISTNRSFYYFPFIKQLLWKCGRASFSKIALLRSR
jgi:hypothetical protein